MPQKTKIILIVTFILVVGILIGVYFYFTSKSTPAPDQSPSLLQKFNPFGTSTKITPTTPDKGTEGPTVENGAQTSRFYQITNFAIAGATFLEDTRKIQNTDTNIEPSFEMAPSVRYVERATGHIYQTYLDTKKTGTISNTTIPGVYEAIFSGLGTSTIYRYPSFDNNSITSFLASLGGDSNFLSSDIVTISVSPDKNSFFSIIKNLNGEAVGTINSFEDNKTNQVFSSPFSEWSSEWVTDGSVYLTTKPSYLVPGVVFSLNIKNGTLTKLFGSIAGLTTLANNTGELVLYSASLNIGPKLNIFDIKNHTSLDLDVYGLPEKCIWSNDNINVYCAIPNTIIGTQYPDYWYQGLVSFTDYFVKINTTTKEVSTLANSQDETPIDATNLFLSKTEDKLFFTNKKDSTLWSLDL